VEKRGALSLFVRNEAGLNVGLRREAITQMATYVSLITDYGYGRARTKFESRHMDVVVYDRKDAWIYAENKAAEKTLAKLCERLQKFETEIPRIVPRADGSLPHDDAVMKAQHLWLHRPPYFWAVAPTLRRAYQVRYGRSGFNLEPVGDIPLAGMGEGGNAASEF
jgi:hypothetical protein